MEDSQRAAEFSKEYKIDVGLHLNFTEKLTQRLHNSLLCEYHELVSGFLTKRRYNSLFYNPVLRKQFNYVYRAQVEEFERLYGVSPSHIDGHHHMHICANMLIGAIIPRGQKVRRNFSFVRGEKRLLNRMYRAAIDKWLARRYLTADYLFSLSESINTGRLSRALELAKAAIVELETHPERIEEFEWLMGKTCLQAISNLQKVTYKEVRK